MDTVKVSIAGTPAPPIVKALAEEYLYSTGTWECRRRDEPRRMGGRRTVCSLRRRKPFIDVRVVDGNFEKASFSLPEVLHGCNGMQIKSQMEVDQAMQRAKELIGEMADAPVRVLRFLRVDFAYNYECDVPSMLARLQQLKHPRIRKDGVRYQNNGIQLAGVQFTLSLYSKTAQRIKKSGLPRDRRVLRGERCLRIEFQAKTPKAIKSWLRQDDELYRLDFARLWKAFHAFLAESPRETVFDGPCTLSSAIALLHRNDIRLPGGLSAYNWWAHGKSPDTIRKDGRKILNISFGGSSLRLADMVPAEPPADFFDVYPDGSGRRVGVDQGMMGASSPHHTVEEMAKFVHGVAAQAPVTSESKARRAEATAASGAVGSVAVNMTQPTPRRQRSLRKLECSASEQSLPPRV